MRMVRQASAQAAALVADITRMAVPSAEKKNAPARARDTGATSTRAVITSSVFIVLLATALLLGGHAAIDPFLHQSPDMLDARGPGDVVVTMPDGKFCRHMSFDNTTASMVEGAIEPCRVDITRDRGTAVSSPQRGFAWGLH
jgi:chemotaxis response regulator CheB